MDIMTDKQIEIILKLVASKFEACKDMGEVRSTIQEIKDMAVKNPQGQKE